MPTSIGIVGYEVAQHERIAALIAAVGGPVKAAAVINRTRTHIDNLRKPDYPVTLKDLLPLCIEAGVSIDWVATGHQIRPDLEAALLGPKEGFASLLPLNAATDPELVMPDTWFSEVLQLPPESARYAMLADDGLAPRLPRGAMAVVDIRPAPLRSGDYLVGLEEGFVARHLISLPGGKRELVADTLPWRLDLDGATLPAGTHRIVWHGQRA